MWFVAISFALLLFVCPASLRKKQAGEGKTNDWETTPHFQDWAYFVAEDNENNKKCGRL